MRPPQAWHCVSQEEGEAGERTARLFLLCLQEGDEDVEARRHTSPLQMDRAVAFTENAGA